jgi:Kdo2-lipid IVA lauroyltransferase/acyltransferase
VKIRKPVDRPVPRWKQFRYRLEWFGLTAAAWVIRRLPYDTLEPLSSFLGSLVYAIDRRGRDVALENLRVAFGNRHSVEEREVIACKSYENFARTMLCLFWSPNLTRDNYRDYIRVDGLESDPAHLDPGRSGVYFLGHFSNFEWLALFSAYALMPGILIAQAFKNPALNPIFDSIRSGTGHQMISRERALIRMLKFVRQGGKVGAAADLSVDPRLGAIPIRCFGLWTAGSPMAALLSTRENAPLFLAEMNPEPDGKFRMVLHRRLELSGNAGPQEITQRCWDALEKLIRARPDLWLWNYKQWRFRPARAAKSQYPAYAHVAPRFDRMLREYCCEYPKEPQGRG